MRYQKVLLLALFLGFFLSTFSHAANSEILSGSVISVETAGKYTILQIQQGKKKLWVAANGFVAQLGDKIEYMGGVPMKDFYVKSLDRTFPEILFLTNIRKHITEEQKATAAETAPTKMPNDEYHKNMAASPAVAAPSAEEMAGLAAKLTIAELFAQREFLAGKVVSVRGKVMKLAKKIRGSTWVTLSDGTGIAPDDVLRVTTLQEVAIGEAVSVTGKVKINIDLGAGYKYRVILEEATFTRK